jgi:serum/glucocorticoid-regulated kinase 2
LLIFPATASEIGATQPQSQRRSGILIVTLHEGIGFSIPDQYLQLVNYHHGKCSSKYMPYALLDFDGSQVFVNTVAGTPEKPLWAGNTTPYKFDVSRVSQLAVLFYLGNLNATQGSGRTQDIFLGVARIDPEFEQSHQCSAAWLDIQCGTGKIHINLEYVHNPQASRIEHFELLEIVGRGSFGKVMKVKKIDTHRIYALKTFRKAHILSPSEGTLSDRFVLSQINNPFIVPLKFTFQSPEKVYIVSAFVQGGGLFYHLQREPLKRFDVNRSRLYTAELLCALECLHGFGIIYDDLKPENIHLDYSGHICLADFGFCQLDIKDGDDFSPISIAGTPDYLAPELFLGQAYTKTVDWWTLGVLLYQMLTGSHLFYDKSTSEIHRKIISKPLHFPDFIPPSAKDILTKLLNRNPKQRLGANGVSEIKAHPFFDCIDWAKLLRREYEPTFKPNDHDRPSLGTCCSFDVEICDDAQKFSDLQELPVLSEKMQHMFRGWSYNRPREPAPGDGGGIASGSVQDNGLSPE